MVVVVVLAGSFYQPTLNATGEVPVLQGKQQPHTDECQLAAYISIRINEEGKVTTGPTTAFLTPPCSSQSPTSIDLLVLLDTTTTVLLLSSSSTGGPHAHSQVTLILPQ